MQHGKEEQDSAGTGTSAARTTGRRKNTAVIYVTFLILTLDLSMMFLQFSVTPYLAKKLGFDTLWFGYLQTTVGVAQLIGGPVFGRFGDLFGARAALTLVCSANVVFFVLLALANHPILLFVHKIPTIFMHIVPACQMVLTDLSEPEKRADVLSKTGLCFGISLILGSTLGGQLNARFGESFTASVGAAVSAFNLLLVLCFIPKFTKTEAPRSSNKTESQNQGVFNIREITRLMKYPRVMQIFLIKVIGGLPAGIFQVMFSIVSMDFFQLQPEEHSYLMAFFGIVQMVIQGAVIGRLANRFPEKTLLLLSIGVAALVGLVQTYMETVFQLCISITLMMFSLSVLNVITDSILTKSVPSSDSGTMLGLCASVQSLIRTIGPTAGGFLYVNYGLSSLGLLQLIVNGTVFVYLLSRRLRNSAKDD
uniref:Organic cation transporter-like protein 2 n=1 Tax=Oryzias latipes TaxID=8090 RepID=A0A3P9KB84_ORYLA